MQDIAEQLREKINRLPELPGIYKFYDAGGNIIYIGKSKCLKKRVKSYFVKSPKWEKVKKLVCFIKDIGYTVTDTHLEARLLECELIKANKPYFNSQMKNDQRYVYLKAAVYNNSNPLTVIPERDEDSFGPFRSRYTLLDIADSLRNIYPILKGGQGYVFEYHLLPVSLDREAFLINRNHLLEILKDSRNMDLFLLELEDKMKEAASFYKFETASRYRDILSGFKYIRHGIAAYENLLSRSIILKLPYTEGFKLFYISGGRILIKENFPALTEKTMKDFIKKGKSRAASGKWDLSADTELFINEKMRIDFRDVMYSEIMSLPEEMVTIL